MSSEITSDPRTGIFISWILGGGIGYLIFTCIFNLILGERKLSLNEMFMGTFVGSFVGNIFGLFFIFGMNSTLPRFIFDVLIPIIFTIVALRLIQKNNYIKREFRLGNSQKMFLLGRLIMSIAAIIIVGAFFAIKAIKFLFR